MTIIAKLIFKLDAPVHVFGVATETFNLDDLSVEEKNDFIDAERNKISTFIEGVTVDLYLVYGWVENPLIKGHQAAGIDTIEMNLISKDEAWDGEASEHYREREARFSRISFTVLNRLIKHFRFKKNNPFLRPANYGNLKKWTWHDEHHQMLYEVPRSALLAQFPGLNGPLKSTGLRKSDLAKIGAILSIEPKIEVVDELMMHAREAIHEKACLLAILLLAVAVEVKVKTSFLGTDSSASNAFDFAQEKGKIAVSPVEFISEIAKLTFNESFKRTNKADYINIENLFRSRNKVAHRGKGIYSDENGVLQTVDLATLKIWWKSVAVLFQWLSDKTGHSAIFPTEGEPGSRNMKS